MAVSGFSSAFSGFDVDKETKDNMLISLQDFARGIVEAKAKEEAGRVLIRMKDRWEYHTIVFVRFELLAYALMIS